MSSSEFIRCKICGKDFDTTDSLKEHQAAEKEEQELRSKGFSDG
jgi:transcription initiation factor IIE alpha subunit